MKPHKQSCLQGLRLQHSLKAKNLTVIVTQESFTSFCLIRCKPQPDEIEESTERYPYIPLSECSYTWQQYRKSGKM